MVAMYNIGWSTFDFHNLFKIYFYWFYLHIHVLGNELNFQSQKQLQSQHCPLVSKLFLKLSLRVIKDGMFNQHISFDEIHECDVFSATKATLELQMSVCHKNPSASLNHAYLPNLSLSQPTCPLTITPIGHHATQPPWTPPPSQSLRIIGHHAYQPSCQSAIFDLNSQLLSLFACFLSKYESNGLGISKYEFENQ